MKLAADGADRRLSAPPDVQPSSGRSCSGRADRRLGDPAPAADPGVTGTITSTGSYSFTVQTPGRPTGVLAALTTAANKITAEDYPYVWGGGHGEAGIASVGEKGPGYNGKRRGYDCSGSVAAVLSGAGLWPAGAGVPNDAGVIQYLRQHGEIAPGAGDGPGEVTLYDDPGVHIFMNINGRFFGTSDGGGGGDKQGRPRLARRRRLGRSQQPLPPLPLPALGDQGDDRRRLHARVPVRNGPEHAGASGRRQRARRLPDHQPGHDGRHGGDAHWRAERGRHGHGPQQNRHQLHDQAQERPDADAAGHRPADTGAAQRPGCASATRCS